MFDILKPSIENRQKAKEEFKTVSKQFWDPVDKHLNLGKIEEHTIEINSKLTELKENPKIIKKQLRVGLLIGIIGTILVLFLVSKIDLGEDGFKLAIFGIIMSWMYYTIIKTYYRNLAKDLIKAKIAKENGWLYDSEKDTGKWIRMKEYFPEIFRKGNKDQYVDDQFWGITEYRGKHKYFTSGNFSYTVESGSGKNRNSTTYNNHYFIFPLEKEIKARFLLYPEGIGSKFMNFFKKKEINTESISFNKEFAFSYNGQKGDKALNIVKTLSPAVQEKLLKLKEEKGSVSVLFVQNTIVFLFKGFLIKEFYTNFKKEVKIDPRDKESVSRDLNKLIEISNEMGKYIN